MGGAPSNLAKNDVWVLPEKREKGGGGWKAGGGLAQEEATNWVDRSQKKNALRTDNTQGMLIRGRKKEKI